MRPPCCVSWHRAHIAELANAKPKQPFFFLKPPSSIVLPGEGPCLQPRGVRMHYEVELALVMGRTVRDLHAHDTQTALDSIRGEQALFLFSFFCPVLAAFAAATLFGFFSLSFPRTRGARFRVLSYFLLQNLMVRALGNATNISMQRRLLYLNSTEHGSYVC